jgi:hypothetical protein
MMTSFVLRIFFAGLIAFVPSRDGRVLNVLVVDSGAGETTSDGMPVPRHHALLLARAGGCSGACTIDNSVAAGLLFPRAGSAGKRFLAAALARGSAWELAASDLEIAGGAAPFSPSPPVLGELSQVADLGRIVPGAGVVNPGLLGCQPPKGLISARLRLRAGTISTQRLARIGGQEPVFGFKTLAGGGEVVGYSQPIADWLVAEIEVPGDEVEIVERNFETQEVRTMRLSPQGGPVELALLNVPEPPAPMPGGGRAADAVDSAPGAHFEQYYKLAKTPPPAALRPVPQARDGERSPASGPGKVHSQLLDGLGLGDPKGFYARVICAVAQLSDGG